MPRSMSYYPCNGCTAHCDFPHDTEPCWGEVIVVDESPNEFDAGRTHACQGHRDRFDGGTYRPEV